MIPHTELQQIAQILREAAADLEAGKLRSIAFSTIGGPEDKTFILAPLPDATVMVLSLQIAVQESLKETRMKHTLREESHLFKGENVKL